MSDSNYNVIITDFLNDNFTSLESLDLVDNLLKQEEKQRQEKTVKNMESEKLLKVLVEKYDSEKNLVLDEISTYKNLIKKLKSTESDEKDPNFLTPNDFIWLENLKKDLDDIKINQVSYNFTNAVAKMSGYTQQFHKSLETDITASLKPFECMVTTLQEFKEYLLPVLSKKEKSSEDTFKEQNSETEYHTISYMEGKLKTSWKSIIESVTEKEKHIIELLLNDSKNPKSSRHSSNSSQFSQIISEINLTENLYQGFSLYIKSVVGKYDPTGISQKWNSQLSIAVIIDVISAKFLYHFGGSLETNRPDKPEWWIDFLLKHTSHIIEFIENDVQKIIWSHNPLGSEARDEYFDGVINIICQKLTNEKNNWETHPQFVGHLVKELSNFDTTIESLYLYGVNGNSKKTWAGSAEKWLLSNKPILESWCNYEFEATSKSFNKIRDDPIAFELGTGFSDKSLDYHVFATPISIQIESSVNGLVERISNLKNTRWKYNFISFIVFPLMRTYIERLFLELSKFKKVSFAFIQSIPGGGTIRQTAGYQTPFDGTSDLSSLKLDIQLESTGIKPIVLQMGVVSGLIYSAHYVNRQLEDWSYEEFWIELWNWICTVVSSKDNSFKKTNSNFKGNMDSNDTDTKNRSNTNTSFEKEEFGDTHYKDLREESLISFESDNINYGDVDIPSEISDLFDKKDFSSLTRIKKVQAEKTIFDFYRLELGKFVKESLESFAFIMSKEIIRILQPYFNELTNTETVKNRNKLASTEENDDLSHINENGDDAEYGSSDNNDTKSLAYSMKTLSLLLGYTQNHLLLSEHFKVVVKNALLEVDNWAINNVIFSKTWDDIQANRFAMDIASIVKCIYDSVAGVKSAKLYFKKRGNNLGQCVEAAYLLSLPFEDRGDLPINIYGICTNFEYVSPEKISDLVSQVFLEKERKDSLSFSRRVKNDFVVGSPNMFTGANQDDIDLRKQQDGEEKATSLNKLKSFGITELGPNKAWTILHRRSDSEKLFQTQNFG
ncbi:hypothetical protein BB558_000101 [Smittium angustum]|uniref:Uncharacterized protein n=1 Tax=Smittium angustum TaxID=133377 RepID=A0A2U1JF28_SMIAN|nr:hypothetical protein BB558_000320 [Smittium angustum]PWA03720.1 hypothetical protein BB558_000101 [Smittium angustum]